MQFQKGNFEHETEHDQFNPQVARPLLIRLAKATMHQIAELVHQHNAISLQTRLSCCDCSIVEVRVVGGLWLLLLLSSVFGNGVVGFVCVCVFLVELLLCVGGGIVRLYIYWFPGCDLSLSRLRVVFDCVALLLLLLSLFLCWVAGGGSTDRIFHIYGVLDLRDRALLQLIVWLVSLVLDIHHLFEACFGSNHRNNIQSVC